MGLVTGNEVETICQVLTLVGPDTPGIVLSLSAPNPGTHRPVTEDGSGEGGRTTCSFPPLILHLPTFSASTKCVHAHMYG